jgi:pimeloyl-ACP methyl ester carboxylesterase
MPQDTHETTPIHFAEAGGLRFAYRRFGRRGGTPLLLLNYFAANLDNWDPKVTIDHLFPPYSPEKNAELKLWFEY